MFLDLIFTGIEHLGNANLFIFFFDFQYVVHDGLDIVNVWGPLNFSKTWDFNLRSWFSTFNFIFEILSSYDQLFRWFNIRRHPFLGHGFIFYFDHFWRSWRFWRFWDLNYLRDNLWWYFLSFWSHFFHLWLSPYQTYLTKCINISSFFFDIFVIFKILFWFRLFFIHLLILSSSSPRLATQKVNCDRCFIVCFISLKNVKIFFSSLFYRNW